MRPLTPITKSPQCKLALKLGTKPKLNYILGDTRAKVLITKAVSPVVIPAEYGIQTFPAVLAIDSKELEVELAGESTQNLAHNISSSNLAYVIYTSGTTGRPKGVMVEHKGLYQFILGMKKQYTNASEFLSVLSTTSYIFDIFGLEYLLPLSSGG